MTRTKPPLVGTWKTMNARTSHAQILAILPHIRAAVETRDFYRINILTTMLAGLASGARMFTPRP